MRYRYLFLFIFLFFFSCKEKKKTPPTGDEPVEISDFIGYFPERKLPFQFDATNMLKKEKDSFLIPLKVFSQFIPDSIRISLVGPAAALKIYPLGRTEAPGGENYLFAKTITTKGNQVAGIILAFDDKKEFGDAMLAWRTDRDMTKTLSGTTVMDTRHTITRTVVRKNQDGSISEGKDIYAWNADSREFSLIMTDAIGDNVTELINPIDTFSRKHKYAGDYTSAKANLISVRDGRKADRLSFFIHFEKNSGSCIGELKGEAQIRSANMAEYRQAGDPCVLQFRFTTNAVTLKELEGCGSHRGLRCSFDGVYPRKKVAKPKPTKKVTKKK